jgi:hypothetical protein
MTVCPIWGTYAEELPSDGDYQTFRSPRVSGEFRISGSAMPAINVLNDQEKIKLTSHIANAHNNGVTCPLITSAVLDSIKQTQRVTFSEKLENTFRLLAKLVTRIDFEITLPRNDDSLAAAPDPNFKHHIELSQNIMAVSQLYDVNELYDFFMMLTSMSYFSYTPGIIAFKIAPLGLQKLDSLRLDAAQSKTAFVAMWFGHQMNHAYIEGIGPAIKDAGYKPLRIDQKDHNNKIDDEIIAEIRAAKFVIADFTSELFERPQQEGVQSEAKTILIPRGGVYYEAGFAQGLGKPVIWTVHKDCLDHVHFDTRQFNHIVWTDAADLKRQLYQRITATLGPAPGTELLSNYG